MLQFPADSEVHDFDEQAVRDGYSDMVIAATMAMNKTAARLKARR